MGVEKYVRRAVRVQMARDNIGLYKLAKLSGVSHATLSNVMNGHRSWSFTTLEKVSTALGWDDAFGLIEAAISEKKKDKNMPPVVAEGSEAERR